MNDPRNLLQEILSNYTDADKWIDSTFERIKRLSNTKVGDVGQDFIEKLCKNLGFNYEMPRKRSGEREKNSPWDIQIEGVEYELKTATEDVSGSFQFNHIRYHRDYDALLCLGITPEEIFFGAWSKADVTTSQAGRLIPMEKGTSASHKLTKKPGQLYSIDQFENHIRELTDKIRKQKI